MKRTGVALLVIVVAAWILLVLSGIGVLYSQEKTGDINSYPVLECSYFMGTRQFVLYFYFDNHAKELDKATRVACPVYFRP